MAGRSVSASQTAPPVPRCRLAVAALSVCVCTLGGCDTGDADLVAPGDGLVVSLAGDDLRLETEDLVACVPPPLLVDVEASGSALELRVRGRGPVSLVQCDGPEQPAEFRADLPAVEVLSVEVRQGTAADRYVVRRTRGGTFLDAVRTSFTRPGPR